MTVTVVVTVVVTVTVTGLKFHLSRHLDDQSVQEAGLILEEHGGRQVPSAAAARFTVVPLVHPPSGEDPDPEQMVTLAYLQHCVEADKVGHGVGPPSEFASLAYFEHLILR